jgi:hypothetical protein
VKILGETPKSIKPFKTLEEEVVVNGPKLHFNGRSKYVFLMMKSYEIKTLEKKSTEI